MPPDQLAPFVGARPERRYLRMRMTTTIYLSVRFGDWQRWRECPSKTYYMMIANRGLGIA